MMKTKRRLAIEREHDFTLVLLGVNELTPKVVDALFEAGCDDATMCRRFGRVFLTFSRTTATLKDAIVSAIRDVRKANIGARVLRVDECSLLAQADIARKVGRPRQVIHQYISGQRGPGGFPPPVCHIRDGAPLWHWCEVARWFWQNDMIKESELREAEQVSVINAVLELQNQRQVDPELAEEVRRSIGG